MRSMRPGAVARLEDVADDVGAPVPMVEGKTSDCTYPPGPLPVVTRQRTKYPARPATATGPDFTTLWDSMPP
ncbi:hypothetical protein SHIRM173S_11496 [Streptomyces hirsutus]